MARQFAGARVEVAVDTVASGDNMGSEKAWNAVYAVLEHATNTQGVRRSRLLGARRRSSQAYQKVRYFASSHSPRANCCYFIGLWAAVSQEQRQWQQ